ncbi:MAG: PAS domain S-box protein, partial [Cyclobacteriaceae bacterium]
MLEKFKDAADSSTEGLLRSILESSFYGIMTLKALRDDSDQIIDFELIFANDVAADIVGKKPDDLLDARLLELMPGIVDSGLFEEYKKVTETGEFITLEQFYEDEEVSRWYKISGSKLSDGLTVTFQDISDLKEAIADVKSEGKKYRRLFEESIDPIFLADASSQFLDTNKAFEELFVYGEGELICMTLSQLFKKKSDFKLFQKKLLDRGKVEEHEVVMTDKDGRKKTCLINCDSYYNEESQQKHTIGVIKDMSKRKKADRDILMAEKLSMTGKIARTIAHEVRNPLTNLTLALEQLKDEVSTESEDLDLYFDIIRRNADRIGKLITDLLNSSKPKELNPVSQSLNDVVKEALGLVRDRLKLKQMELVEKYAKDLPSIPIDGDQFKVALLNLFVNAIE